MMGATQTDAAVFALMEIVADPVKAKTRIKELRDAEANAKAAIDSLSSERAKVQQVQQENDARKAALDEREEKIESAETNIRRRLDMIANRERQLDERERSVAKAALDKDTEHARRINAVTSREMAVTEREQKHAADATKYADDRAALDRKMKAMRAALSE